MNDEQFRRIVQSKEAAHAAAIQGYEYAKTLIDNGQNVLITVGPALEPIGVKQRNFYHGVVLTQISEQVRVRGERFVVDIWAEFFRKLFLPDKWEQRKLPGQKRKTPHRVRQSTETLGPKKYSELIDKVTAHAATEFGVHFTFEDEGREAVRYNPRPRKQAEPS